MNRRESSARGFVLAALVMLGVLGCDQPDFTPRNQIESVRILASRANKPYAQPGDAITIDVLAVDGRPAVPAPTAPMKVYWLPAPCINPPADAYYACFPAFASTFVANADATPKLIAGDQFSFQMPLDAISGHAVVPGLPNYGIAIAFSIACAGHVEYAPPPPGGALNQIPFGCFDEARNRLGPDDFVFAFSTVYAFADRATSNPAIASLSFDNQPVDLARGISVAQCTEEDLDDCTKTDIEANVAIGSAETFGADHESAWVDYYTTVGKVRYNRVVVFDVKRGAIGSTANEFYSPLSKGDGRLFAVVHDSRSGVNWIEVPIQTR